MDTPLLISDTHRTDPINQCVYCGSKHNLTDEHIVPFALGGRYILSKSSCENCSTIISKIERKVLRGFMLEARTVGNFPTRNKKTRAKSLPLEVNKDDAFSSIELLPENHPGILTLPMLALPGFWTGISESENLTIVGSETIRFGKDINEIGKSLNAKEIRVAQELDVWAFARMISKIAYCYAIASVGVLPIKKIPVIPFILNQKNNGSMWMGSNNFRLKNEDQKPTFALGVMLSQVSGYNYPILISQIKLFADVGTTGYEVFICETDDEILNIIVKKNSDLFNDIL